MEDKPAAGMHRMVIQAENVADQMTKEGVFPGPGEEGDVGFLRFRPGELKHYGDLSSLQIHMFPAWGWVNTIVYPDAIDYASGVVTLKKTRSASEEVRSGNRYFVANAREDMDRDGEWWFDRRTGTMLVRAKVAPVGAVAARLDRLLELRGSAVGGGWVDDVRVRGLVFRDTTCSGDIGVYAPDDAAVQIVRAQGGPTSKATASWVSADMR